jgi:hypothetical protein
MTTMRLYDLRVTVDRIDGQPVCERVLPILRSAR